MKRILKEQDETGSFGNVLANIQVLPALVGRSLVNLNDLACPQLGEYADIINLLHFWMWWGGGVMY